MTNILIVEDDKVLCKAMQDLLEKNDFEVTIAENGQVGLEKLQEVLPDLILLDIVMPIVDGFQFHQEISKDSKFKDIPVIFLTNLDGADNKKKAFNSGAVDYFVKSNTDLSYLVDKINEHLS